MFLLGACIPRELALAGNVMKYFQHIALTPEALPSPTGGKGWRSMQH